MILPIAPGPWIPFAVAVASTGVPPGARAEGPERIAIALEGPRLGALIGLAAQAIQAAGEEQRIKAGTAAAAARPAAEAGVGDGLDASLRETRHSLHGAFGSCRIDADRAETERPA